MNKFNSKQRKSMGDNWEPGRLETCWRPSCQTGCSKVMSWSWKGVRVWEPRAALGPPGVPSSHSHTLAVVWAQGEGPHQDLAQPDR